MKRTDEKEYTIDIAGERGGEAVLSLGGRIGIDNLPAIMAEIDDAVKRLAPAKLTVDAANLDYLDSAGALALLQMEHEAKARSVPVEFVNLSKKVRGVMGLLDRKVVEGKPLIEAAGPASLIAQVGDETARLAQDFVQLITFLGEVIAALASSLRHPRTVRWDDVLLHCRRAGVDGLPIVGFISFLLGFVIAVMAATRLVQSSFNIYLGSVVAIGMIKEFGPLITAIIVAGRTGSAFAAEIGTMTVNEEVNALAIMGFDPITFLAVPRILAVAIVVPVLTLFADFFGVLGGVLVGMANLDLAPYVYFLQIRHDIAPGDVMLSAAKSVIFAVIIAGVGCHRGFRVKGGAQGVGATTTSAAVTAIFLTIVADAVFAEFINYLHFL